MHAFAALACGAGQRIVIIFAQGILGCSGRIYSKMTRKAWLYPAQKVYTSHVSLLA